MPEKDLMAMHQSIVQLRRTERYDKRDPVFDFGFFLLTYLLTLVALSTLLLAFDVPIGRFHCLYAIPIAWGVLAYIRKAPWYSLTIALFAIVFMLLCAHFASQFIDLDWDSNKYHMADAGLLAEGWNPFRSSMMDYTAKSAALPGSGIDWLTQQVDNQPKASFTIAACFYAFFGALEFGKAFNLISMAACLCISAPLIRDALKLSRLASGLCVFFAVVNPVTVTQVICMYNDGFVFQILTIVAVCLAYMAFCDEGRYAYICKWAAFMAICLAVNVKTSALIHCAILWLFYYFARLAIGYKQRLDHTLMKKRNIAMVWYWAAWCICAVLVVGSITYVVNWYRYGSPVAGMLGETSINTMITDEMGLNILALPSFVQFFIALFSPSENITFTAIRLKLPFTFSLTELAASAEDTRMGGWGFLYSGIFLISLVVIIITLIRLKRNRSKYYGLLLISLIVVFVPVFIVPYLWWGRYYCQLFWISSIALCCLFAPNKKEGMGRRIGSILLGIAMCGLLTLNMLPQYNRILERIEDSASQTQAVKSLKVLSQIYDLDVSGMVFPGSLYNLRDGGLEGYTHKSLDDLAEVDGGVLKDVFYDLKWKDGQELHDASELLNDLRSRDDCIIAIVARDECTRNLSNDVIDGMRALGLQFNMEGALHNSYIALIDDGAVVYEHQAPDAATIVYDTNIDGIQIDLMSIGDVAYGYTCVTMDGILYSIDKRGYNIVVYDKASGSLIHSVGIDSYEGNEVIR